MNELGQKIRRLRSAAQMTQAELAGDLITRNMLSQIENGSAQPSLTTIMYLAERLDVPVGYFFADEENEFFYRKIQRIGEIKRAYKAGAWQKCMALCQDIPGGSDDEINLIMCRCAYQIAQLAFADGRLCAAHTCYVQTLMYAGQTVYDTAPLARTAYDYLTYLERFDSALEIPGFLQVPHREGAAEQPWFSCYLRALRAIEQGRGNTAETLLLLSDFAETTYAAHIRARLSMMQHRYAAAIEIIEAMLTPERGLPPSKPMTYLLYGDLEVCCRENGDFERAYRYTTSRVKLLDVLLTD